MEIGKYTTVGVKLGQGAFGTVELATDITLYKKIWVYR